MLCDLILKALFWPIWTAVHPLRGQWSSLHESTADFFWLLGIIVMPGLVLAAPLAFALEGLAAGRVTGLRRRVLLVGGGSLLYALLSGIMACVAALGPAGITETSEAILIVPLTIIQPRMAHGVFGFWLPSIVCGAYVMLSRRPKWWAASILGTAVLILGVWLWILLGTLVGAPND